MALTRLLFASDVHGSDPVWKKFIRGVKFYKADVLIFGGDLTGKTVVTVKENANGTYGSEVQKQNDLLKKQGGYTTSDHLSDSCRFQVRYR